MGTTEYDYEIDAKTGDVLKVEKNVDDDAQSRVPVTHLRVVLLPAVLPRTQLLISAATPLCRRLWPMQASVLRRQWM